MGQSDTVDYKKVVIRNPLDGIILFIARRFGSRSKEVERFLKFATVGAIGAVIDFGLVFILQASLLPPSEPNRDLKVRVASTIGFLAAVISNFIWNRFWTYPDSRSRSIRRQLAQFTVINLVGWLGRTLWVGWAYIWLGVFLMEVLLPAIQILRPAYAPSHEAEAKLGTLAAQLIGVVVVMMWNFFANRYWTYNNVDKTQIATDSN